MRMYDICIIGAGPAGLTLCAELASSGKKIALIESGGKEKSPHADDLRKVVSTGDVKIKESSRERIFGGTSTTWTGLSSPMDPIDFARWPISLEEMKPYYERCFAYGFPEYKAFFSTSPTCSTKIEEKKFIASTPAWNFGKNLTHLLESKNITTYLNSTVIGIDSTLEKKVRAVRIRQPNKPEEIIEARIFVLAAGGIENARLLLISRLGNEHDQVGRYIMNHPKGTFGTLKLSKPIRTSPYIFKKMSKDWSGYSGLRLTDEMQKSLGVLNTYLRYDVRPTRLSRILMRIFCRNILPIRTVRLWNFMEMEPQKENRITLSNEVDSYGIPLPQTKIHVSELDKKSLIELHRILREEFEKNGVGKIESNLDQAKPWPITADASHHLGGTIMGNDPKTSVVDKNLKVHSVDNLYVVTGSVFPTSGCANPTYTICALSIRLADRLRTV